MAEQADFHRPDGSDFADLALSRIPSKFARLAFVAGLIKESLEGDKDSLAALVYGKDQFYSTLRQKHQETFRDFLISPLARQTEEVAEYLSKNQSKPTTQILRDWIEERFYKDLIPAAATDQETDLFSSDLRAILNLLLVRLSVQDGKGNQDHQAEAEEGIK